MQTLIHSKLQKTSIHKPRYHGNGFIQLYLDEAKIKRLHIWTPKLEPQRDHNAQIHDHRFYMHSQILLGKLYHDLYDMQEVSPNDSNHTHNIYTIHGASKFDLGIMEHDRCAIMYLREQFKFVAGCEYEQRNGTFHTSTVDRDCYTATLVTKLPSINHVNKWARVAVAKEIKVENVTHAFDPALQPTQETLWQEINNVLDLICNSAG